ncbi:MAG: AraC family transcriptional regulator [Pseudonocardiaceae bacterium]
MSRLANRGFIDARRTMNPVRRRVRSRGIPPALEGHEIFYTEDPVEAADLIGKALSRGRLTLGEVDAQRFAASLHGVRLRDVSMLYLDLNIAVTLDVPATGPHVAVHMPTNGRAVCMLDGQESEGNATRAVITSPGQALIMRFDHDSPQLIIRIEQDALERHMTRLLGRALPRPIVFDAELDLLTDVAVRWHAAVQLLHTEVFHKGSLLQRGQGIGPLEELIMSSLALVQPSNYHHQLSRPSVPSQEPGRRVIRASLDYIEHHLSEPIAPQDIARNVAMSVRAVQKAFHDELGTTPMGYLRDRRLERAREELIDAVPVDGLTVTEVAYRWGFKHLSNFAVLYRQRWGESPSDTLRR